MDEDHPRGASRDGVTFDDELEALGFRQQGTSRRGGTLWTLAMNRALTFMLHDYGDRVVLTWSIAFGEVLEARGWQTSVTDTSVVELYPRHDVQLPARLDAVEAELRRVLGTLRLDLGDPAL